MRIRICIVLFTILLLFSCSPEPVRDTGHFTIASWNVQTLFDDIEDGDEFSPFTRHEGYNSTKYHQRLERIRNVVKSHLDADIIFFQEVESNKVLEDLLDESLRRRGYIYYGIAQEYNPISVGFISKINPVSTSLHHVGGQRFILRAEFLVRGRQLVVYCLHAKSNLGEAEENRKDRKEYASLLNSLASDDAHSPVIILGDFNCSVVLDASDMLTLCSPYTSSEIVAMDSLPLVALAEDLDDLSFHDPFLDPSTVLGAQGTYYYSGRFHDYDRILYNRSFAEVWGDSSFEIVSATAINGIYPYEYDMETGLGYSDHFPVKLTMRLF